MKKISFNKGKTFYDVDSAKDFDAIMSKLNTKTWKNIVDKMNPETLMENLFYSDENAVKAKTKIDEEAKKKANYFNILRAYLAHAEEDLIL